MASNSAILVRSRPRVGSGSSLVSFNGCLEGFLLAPPLGAVLEKMFTGLDVLAPPAFCVRASGRLLEVLSGKAVASF